MAADLYSALGFQYATVKRWALAIPKGLEPADWLSRPAGMKNHPHWIYGHIALSSDVAKLSGASPSPSCPIDGLAARAKPIAANATIRSARDPRATSNIVPNMTPPFYRNTRSRSPISYKGCISAT